MGDGELFGAATSMMDLDPELLGPFPEDAVMKVGSEVLLRIRGLGQG